MKIEILGTGCPKCKMLESNAKKAIDELKIKAEIIKVTDIDRIIDYGVMTTPAIVVDGKVRSSGKVADVNEIKAFLK